MKKLISIITLCLFCVLGNRAEVSTDKIVAAEAVIDKSATEAVYVQISLQSDNIYSGYNVDVYLPQGITMAKFEGEWDAYLENDMYPEEPRGGGRTHSLMGEYNADKNFFRAACISTKSRNMKSASGALFSIGLLPTASAVPGTYEIKLTEVCLISSEAVNYFTSDTTAKLVITDVTGIQNVQENVNTALYTVDGIRVAAPQKGRLYIVDGKKMKF